MRIADAREGRLDTPAHQSLFDALMAGGHEPGPELSPQRFVEMPTPSAIL